MTSAASENLAETYRVAASTWREARAVWQDGIGLSFERRCWNPLESAIVEVLRAAEELASALDEAERVASKS